MFRNLLLISLPAALTLTLVPACAGTLEYNLTVDQCTGVCGPSAPLFGTITLADAVADAVPMPVNSNDGVNAVYSAPTSYAPAYQAADYAPVYNYAPFYQAAYYAPVYDYAPFYQAAY